MTERKKKKKNFKKLLGETTIPDTEQSNLIDEQLNVKKIVNCFLLKIKYQKDELYFAQIFDFAPYENSVYPSTLIL